MADPIIDPRSLPATTMQPGSVLPPPQQQASNVLGPTNPVDPYGVAQEQIQRQRALAGLLTPLLQQQQQQTQPLTPDNPQGYPKAGLAQEKFMQMRPMTGQGAGRDIGNIFGNIGRGVLGLASSTIPGQQYQAARYGPGQQAYQARRAGTASQIETIQRQQQLEEAPISPMGELAYHQALVGTREETNRIRQEAEDTRRAVLAEKTQVDKDKLELAGKRFQLSRKTADQRFQAALANIALRGKSLDERTINDQRTSALREYGDDLIAARISAGYDEKTAQLETTIDVANAKMAAEHPVQRVAGNVPQAQKSQKGAAKLPSRPNLPGMGGQATHIWTPQGLTPVGK